MDKAKASTSRKSKASTSSPPRMMATRRTPSPVKMTTIPSPPPPTPIVTRDEEEGNVLSEDSSSEFEVLQVGKHDQDYFEIPSTKKRDRRPGDPPPPPTKDLIYIPKEKLFPFKDLYEKQPQKIKEMLRVTFCDGKPITQPTPLGQFVNGVRKLQDRKRTKKQMQRKLLRTNTNNAAADNQRGGLSAAAALGGSGKKATVNLVDIVENDTQLIHVDYPGRVVHIDKAIDTMGGIGQISRVFNNVNKKLHVKFRPDDPCCNAIKGEATPTIGLLLRVKYRKPVARTTGQQNNSKQKIKKNEPASSKQKKNQRSTKVIQVDEESITISGVRLTKEQILYEDNKLLKQVSSNSEKLLHQYHQSEDLGHCYLKIPKNYTPIVDQKIQIEAIGLVNRTYKFEGICDFQFLPCKPSKFGGMSTREDFFPVVGKPSDDNESLFVFNKLFQDEDRDLHIDFLPPMMSRIDRPVDTVIEHMMDSDNIKLTAELQEKSGVISTTRARRNVYTLFYNFQSERLKSKEIPQEPLKGALEDIKKRPQYESLLELIKSFFDQRPIWSKAELEYESKHASLTLKYALPCLSYFATNGPWRALWIRFGYDPREHQSSFLWQSIDFRIPGIYKCFMEEKADPKFYIFRPNFMPTRLQMFYQLCHIKCDEIDRLIDTATRKAANNELSYDVRYGWLKEGTFDYVRHVITQYLESHLEELGKIPEYPISQVFLEEDELEPPEKLLPRPRIAKRLRKVKSYKPKVAGGGDQAATSSNNKPSKKSRATLNKRKSKVKKESTKWAYQGILEDLSIKDINKYGSRKEDDKEILNEDSCLLSDDSFDYDSTTADDDSDYDPDYSSEVTTKTIKK